MIDKKEPKERMDASDVCWLSPPDIFEALLGDPVEKGFDERTLKRKIKNSRQFICDSRPALKE